MNYANEHKTPDLFLSAYFLNNHLPILDIQIENRLKKKVIFVFPKNERLAELKEQYKHGIAEANVLEFKKNYQHVQDLLYEAKREYGI